MATKSSLCSLQKPASSNKDPTQPNKQTNKTNKQKGLREQGKEIGLRFLWWFRIGAKVGFSQMGRI